MKRENGVPRRTHGGYTLIEQILVLAIATTLLCVGAPALGHLRTRSHLQAAGSDLAAALRAARNLAIETRRRTLLCPTRDGQQCSDSLHWEDGWLVGHYQSEKADQLNGAAVWVTGGQPALTILSTTGRKRIRFQPDGSAGGSNATFTLCSRGDARVTLAITVASSGRILSTHATAEQAQRCASEG
ncbi:GspH/FimT family pseudopilin [Dyella sp. C9]|uniref:GspH/FimT family pseudopilin n=1 Tax=Dyella sp. C9 TaxID=2202154 RepID=UPI000DEFD7AE|nr:GspH/FimT family pseudopilin [Dyella sp. C9]